MRAEGTLQKEILWCSVPSTRNEDGTATPTLRIWNRTPFRNVGLIGLRAIGTFTEHHCFMICREKKNKEFRTEKRFFLVYLYEICIFAKRNNT